MKDILLTSVCNDEYIDGAKVMLYSMKKNIKEISKLLLLQWVSFL